MSGRFSLLGSLVCATALAAACDSGPEPGSVDAAPPKAATPIGGLYEVSGVTRAARTGDEREISGTIILAEEGDRYIATFNLTTFYPVGGEALRAEVIGKGEGTIDGRTLTGTASTQLVVASIPGVDPAFAFIPRTVTTRIQSTVVTEVASDGEVIIELENQPAPGEEYEPTRTKLTGRRVMAARTAKPD